MKKGINEEVSKHISLLKNEGKNFEEISKELNLNSFTIKNHYYKHIHKKQQKEDAPLYSSRNNCSDNGNHGGKMVWIVDALKDHINQFNHLLIIGYQNCEELTDWAIKKGKEVTAIDYKKERFNGNKTIKTFLTDCLQPEFKYWLEGFKLKNPECSVFINLTGRKDFIETVYDCGFRPIVAVVSPRPGEDSSLEKCEQLNATIHSLSKTNMKIAVFE